MLAIIAWNRDRAVSSNSTFGVPKVEKFEIRISKSETNPNFQMFK